MKWAIVCVFAVLLIYNLVSGSHLPSLKLHLLFSQFL